MRFWWRLIRFSRVAPLHARLLPARPLNIGAAVDVSLQGLVRSGYCAGGQQLQLVMRVTVSVARGRVAVPRVPGDRTQCEMPTAWRSLSQRLCSAAMSGKQIKLFLVDGSPGGLTTAEITNWTGHVLAAARSDLAGLLRRDEAQRTGAYMLLGDDEAAAGNIRCYIGEADIVADRLRHHHRDKDFWDRVVVITSKDANLTKAHGRYLESRLLDLATRAGRVTLENGTAPAVPAMPEADASDMDYFVSQLQIVLPVLGVNAIRIPVSKPVASPPGDETGSPVFHLRQGKVGVDARAQQIDGEFTMLAGSLVVGSWHGVGKARSTQNAYASYRSQHEQLVEDGAVTVEEGQGRLTRNVVFSSPSTAGAVALGRSCNGRREWISPDGKTFGDWESRGIDQ